jgi:hypothetical protein
MNKKLLERFIKRVVKRSEDELREDVLKKMEKRAGKE